MDVVKTDFTESQIKMLIAILGVKNHPHLTFTNISEAIGVRHSDPNFNKVLKYLSEANIIESIGQNGRARFVRLYHKKLRDLIDEQDIINHYYRYFNEYHYCTW